MNASSRGHVLLFQDKCSESEDSVVYQSVAVSSQTPGLSFYLQQNVVKK